MLFSTFYLVEERTLKLGILQYGKDVSKMYYVVRKHEKKIHVQYGKQLYFTCEETANQELSMTRVMLHN